MALLGSDFDAATPNDADPVSEGAAAIRDIKTRLKAWAGVLFDVDTGEFKSPPSSILVAAAYPSSPAVGDVFYHTGNEAAYIYLAGGWTLLVAPSSPVGHVGVFSGTIAQITAQYASIGGTWMFANGDPISRATYSDYFALVGTTYGVGDGATTFNIPDLRDQMIAGAYSDDSGAAKTRMSDGASLLKSRAYTSHVHTVSNANQWDGNDGTGHVYGFGSTTNANTTRALPPFLAMAYVVRVL